MCFDTTKREAENASHTAERAFNISEQAKERFNSSSIITGRIVGTVHRT